MVTEKAKIGNEVVMAVIKFFYNIDFDEFCKALGDAIGMKIAGGYGLTKWDAMKSDFSYWYGNLDTKTQEHFVQLAMSKYGLK